MQNTQTIILDPSSADSVIYMNTSNGGNDQRHIKSFKTTIAPVVFQKGGVINVQTILQQGSNDSIKEISKNVSLGLKLQAYIANILGPYSGYDYWNQPNIYDVPRADFCGDTNVDFAKLRTRWTLTDANPVDWRSHRVASEQDFSSYTVRGKYNVQNLINRQELHYRRQTTASYYFTDSNTRYPCPDVYDGSPMLAFTLLPIETSQAYYTFGTCAAEIYSSEFTEAVTWNYSPCTVGLISCNYTPCDNYSDTTRQYYSLTRTSIGDGMCPPNTQMAYILDDGLPDENGVQYNYAGFIAAIPRYNWVSQTDRINSNMLYSTRGQARVVHHSFYLGEDNPSTITDRSFTFAIYCMPCGMSFDLSPLTSYNTYHKVRDGFINDTDGYRKKMKGFQVLIRLEGNTYSATMNKGYILDIGKWGLEAPDPIGKPNQTVNFFVTEYGKDTITGIQTGMFSVLFGGCNENIYCSLLRQGQPIISMHDILPNYVNWYMPVCFAQRRDKSAVFTGWEVCLLQSHMADLDRSFDCSKSYSNNVIKSTLGPQEGEDLFYSQIDFGTAPANTFSVTPNIPFDVLFSNEVHFCVDQEEDCGAMMNYSQNLTDYRYGQLLVYKACTFDVNMDIDPGIYQSQDICDMFNKSMSNITYDVQNMVGLPNTAYPRPVFHWEKTFFVASAMMFVGTKNLFGNTTIKSQQNSFCYTFSINPISQIYPLDDTQPYDGSYVMSEEPNLANLYKCYGTNRMLLSVSNNNRFMFSGLSIPYYSTNRGAVLGQEVVSYQYLTDFFSGVKLTYKHAPELNQPAENVGICPYCFTSGVMIVNMSDSWEEFGFTDNQRADIYKDLKLTINDLLITRDEFCNRPSYYNNFNKFSVTNSKIDGFSYDWTWFGKRTTLSQINSQSVNPITFDSDGNLLNFPLIGVTKPYTMATIGVSIPMPSINLPFIQSTYETNQTNADLDKSRAFIPQWNVSNTMDFKFGFNSFNGDRLVVWGKRGPVEVLTGPSSSFPQVRMYGFESTAPISAICMPWGFPDVDQNRIVTQPVEFTSESSVLKANERYTISDVALYGVNMNFISSLIGHFLITNKNIFQTTFPIDRTFSLAGFINANGTYPMFCETDLTVTEVECSFVNMANQQPLYNIGLNTIIIIRYTAPVQQLPPVEGENADK